MRIKLILLAFIYYVSLFASKPEWVTNRPVSDEYFIGISKGVKKNNPNYLTKTKSDALNDLISEIKVSIKSTQELSLKQQNNTINQSFSNNIELKTEAIIEGYELVDTWEDKNEYWVYYRLLKKIYDKNRYKNVRSAIKIGEDLNSRADILDMDEKPIDALLLRYNALFVLNRYIENDLLEVDNGRQSDLVNRWIKNISSRGVSFRR